MVAAAKIAEVVKDGRYNNDPTGLMDWLGQIYEWRGRSMRNIADRLMPHKGGLN